MGKRLGMLLLGGAITATQGKSQASEIGDWLNQAQTFVESIFTSKPESAVTPKSDKIGDYTCYVQEDVRFMKTSSPSFHSKGYSIKLSITWGDSSHQSVSLKSSDPDYDQKTLGFVFSNSTETSYQNNKTAHEGIQLGFNKREDVPGPISIMSQHTLSKTTYQAKIGDCKLNKDSITSQNKDGVASSTKPLTYKGVFIRPKKGDFFSPYWTDPTKASLVGCPSEYCSLASVGQDLVASGITDVFIAFKTDGSAWTTEVRGPDVRNPDGTEKAFGAVKIPTGNKGDLAYPSALYPNNVDPSIIYELKTNPNFDPIKSLMNAIQSVYNTANKTIRFHAWFPVFADWYAAQIEPQKGSANIVNWQDIKISGYALPFIKWPSLSFPTECWSDTGAEPTNQKVVAYELSVLQEIFNLYPSLYGINLDYIRYYFPNDAQNAPCFTKDGTILPSDTYSWRVNPQAINSFVQSVNAQFHSKVISADVFPDVATMQRVGQEGVPNLVKIAMPMAYSRTTGPEATYYSEVKDWITAFEGVYKSTTVIPIIKGFYPSTTYNNLLTDVKTDIKDVLSTDVSGCDIFNYESFLVATNNRQLSTIHNDHGDILF